VNSLRFPIVTIGTDGLWLDEEVDPAGLCPASGQALPLSRLGLRGHLTPLDGEEFLFRGTVTGVFSHACDRCLEEAAFPFEVAATWRFVSAEPVVSGGEVILTAEELDDPAADYTYTAGELDLVPALWEEAEMAFPEKFLCREECRGLCPGCGGNLNERTCACKAAPETDINPGLAGLKDLFPDLPEQPSEE